MESVIRAGDVVALVEEGDAESAGARYLVRASDKPNAERVKGIGVIDLGKLAGMEWGARLRHGDKTFLVLSPGTVDLIRGIARKAQIVLPKDAARILLECDVRAGSHVVEAGVGSGALTIALARAVAPGGRVHTMEIRQDFLDWAKENLARAGVLDHVDLTLGDVTKEIPYRGVDAVVLDVPNPWDAVEHAKRALRPGGFFCAYSPLVSQVEATRIALGRAGFAEARTLELMEREWVVGERGSRPSFDALGHTAFLTFARRLL